jgi:hypothetical protein
MLKNDKEPENKRRKGIKVFIETIPKREKNKKYI